MWNQNFKRCFVHIFLPKFEKLVRVEHSTEGLSRTWAAYAELTSDAHVYVMDILELYVEYL